MLMWLLVTQPPSLTPHTPDPLESPAPCLSLSGAACYEQPPDLIGCIDLRVERQCGGVSSTASASGDMMEERQTSSRERETDL